MIKISQQKKDEILLTTASRNEFNKRIKSLQEFLVTTELEEEYINWCDGCKQWEEE